MLGLTFAKATFRVFSWIWGSIRSCAFRAGNNHSLLSDNRCRSCKASTACGGKGMVMAAPVLVRSAGNRQRAASRSNSLFRAPISSLFLTASNNNNLMVTRLTWVKPLVFLMASKKITNSSCVSARSLASRVGPVESRSRVILDYVPLDCVIEQAFCPA